jgi:Macrocin-O-methyltransferase (TylF)
MREMERWEYGALKIHNPEFSTLSPYFNLIPKLEQIDGDIVEFGVWQGASLATSALILKRLNSAKKIFGYDTFEGFPSIEKSDEFENFVEMAAKGQISKEHFEKIKLNAKHLASQQIKLDPRTISSSSDFSSTSLGAVEEKLEYLNVRDLITLVVVDVTQLEEFQLPEKISLALVDLDLFAGYQRVLPMIWDKLSPGGMIYLDEYYSLKFPGPRLAVDEFSSFIGVKPQKLSVWWDFERWVFVR